MQRQILGQLLFILIIEYNVVVRDIERKELSISAA